MQFGAQLLQINKALVRYRNTRQVGLVNSAYSDLYRVRRLRMGTLGIMESTMLSVAVVW
jgi:hypothetical protein